MHSKRTRRVAAHEVRLEGRILHQAVVEIIGGRVVDAYEIMEEQPMTEWLGGTIEVKGGFAFGNNKRMQ